MDLDSIIIAGRRISTTERQEWTVRQYAVKEQVHPRTVWRWVTKGAVAVRRTPSGRIRILPDGDNR